MATSQAPISKWMLGMAAAAFGFFAARSWTTSRDVGEVTVAVIVLMAIGSITSIMRMRRSAFWIGFVVVGWGWLAISLGTSLAPDLPETKWIDAVRPALNSAPGPEWSGDWLSRMEQNAREERDRDAYRTTGHCIVSLVLACACGTASRKLVVVDDRKPTAWQVPAGSLFRPNPDDDHDSP